MDWKDALSKFAAENDLPEGEETAPVAEPAKAPKRYKLHLNIERKGRGGKTVTVVAGFTEETSDEEIAQLATTLKRALGSGGTVEVDRIIIQGDRRADLRTQLLSLGWKV